MASAGYRMISKEHIDFVESKIEYLLQMEKDEYLKEVVLHLKDYYDIHFAKFEQDQLNNVKKLIFTVGKNNMGTPAGKRIYEVYQKLKAGGISPDEAMDLVGEILSSSDSGNGSGNENL